MRMYSYVHTHPWCASIPDQSSECTRAGVYDLHKLTFGAAQTKFGLLKGLRQKPDDILTKRQGNIMQSYRPQTQLKHENSMSLLHQIIQIY